MIAESQDTYIKYYLQILFKPSSLASSSSFSYNFYYDLRILNINEYWTGLLLFESMCHCLCCDCWWWNCGKICCAGVSLNLLCCSTWCCKAEELLSFHYECMTCCCNKAADRAGCGMVVGCLGSICCAPEWLRQYYKKKQSLADFSSHGWSLIFNSQ